MKHTMTMKERHEWPAWVATAAAILGLVGIAAAQSMPNEDIGLLNAPAMGRDAALNRLRSDHAETAGMTSPISDDGRSDDVPLARQLMLVRHGLVDGPLQVDLFNERGEIVEHMDWSRDGAALKPLFVDALSTGRYAIRISGAGRSETIRFRKD